jgi:plasmid stabilization system protein ParE
VIRRLDLTPEAEADLGEAYGWYRDRGATLAEEFLISLDACFASLQEFPEAHPAVHRGVRRALLRRFPYCVLYVLESSRILVIGVFHARRDPRAWRSRAGAG